MFLSVVIPVYNAARTIRRCLDSIWCQGLPDDDFEVICVDDCSTDNSLDVLEDISHGHPQLRVLRNSENRRAGGARNHGVSKACGEYVVFIDADDYFHPGSLRDAVNYQKKELLDILVCDFARHTEKNPNNSLVHRFKSQTTMTGREFMAVNSLPYAPWKYVFRRTLMSDNGVLFAECVSCEDVDWTHRIAFYAETMQYKPILLTHYILGGVSQTGSEYKRPATVFHRLMAGKRVSDLLSFCQTNKEREKIMAVAQETLWNGIVYLCAVFSNPQAKSVILRECINPKLEWAPKIALVRRHSFAYGVMSTAVSLPFRAIISIKRSLLGR